MASCSLCNSFGSTKVQYNYDLATAHAETHFLQMKIIDDEIDMNQIFGQCFPDFAPMNSQTDTGNSGRQKLLALCRSLSARKSIMSYVVCKRCDEGFKMRDRRKHLDSNVLIEHACNHLKLKAYECLHCVEEFRTKTALSSHLATEHQLRSMIGHCRNKVDDFVWEISAMIKACFGGKPRTGRYNGVTIRSGCVSAVRTRTKGSHLAVERQLFCYQLIRKVAGRHGNVHCHLCSKGIRATSRKGINCNGVREHAYRHLPTPLFRCRLCLEAYFGHKDVGVHLQTAHALPCLEENYECLADQYHSDVMAIMNKCYNNNADSGKEVAFRNLSEPSLRKKSSRTQSGIQRHLLCHRLIRKRANAERLVECRLCSKQISAKMGNTRVMHHAFLHLGKRLYQCKKCSNRFITRTGVQYHLEKEHALLRSNTNYQCLADQFHGDIELILRRCYGEEDDAEEIQVSNKRESKDHAFAIPSTLTMERRSLCARLTRECSDGERLQCRLCNKWLNVKATNGISSEVLMQHAFVHLEKPIFQCKICLDTSITRGNFAHHVRTKHALPMVNNYDYLGDQFHAEIVEMLRKCYNKEPASEFIKPIKSRSRGEASIRRNGSKHTVERQLFCYRLVRKFVNSDGKVECRLCKKLYAGKKGDDYASINAMTHALVHLQRPIYRCVVCSEKRPDKNSINRHLKSAHALPSLNNYECLADEYHSEILAKLSECYGEL